MKTLSFHDLRIGRGRSRSPALLEIDTPTEGIQFGPGLHLIAAPNGRGKTTLLQTIAGILPPVAGQIRADGVALNATEDVLYVSEYLTFPKFIYPAEWIEFMSARRWADTEGELREWIDSLAMGPKLGSFLGRMSQGERRKVTWLGAHASRKPVLLLDEPLDGLDLLGIRAACRLLASWRAAGRTVVVVAHQLGELLDLSDEVWLIGGKKLVSWSRWAGTESRETSAEDFRRRVLEFYAPEAAKK